MEVDAGRTRRLPAPHPARSKAALACCFGRKGCGWPRARLHVKPMGVDRGGRSRRRQARIGQIFRPATPVAQPKKYLENVTSSPCSRNMAASAEASPKLVL